jgi:two-component system, sensor histidine kinase LadS
MSVENSNMRQWLSCLIVWALLCISSGVFATVTFQSTDVAQLQDGHQALGQHLYDLQDPDGRYRAEHLVEKLNSYPWHLNQRAEPNFGFYDEPRWFLLHFHNSQDTTIQRMLELSYALMDHVDFYVVRDGQIRQIVATGDQRPMSARSIDHRNFLLPLDFSPQENIQVLIRVETTGSLQMPLTIWDLREFFRHDQIVYSFQLMFIGIMFGLAVYNFFLFIATRDLSYFWYVGSLVSITGVILCLYGLPAQFVWPEYPKLNNFSLVASISSSLIFASIFTYRFLKLKRYNWFIRGICLSISITGCLLFVGNFILPYDIAIRAGTAMTVIEAVSAICIGLYCHVVESH